MLFIAGNLANGHQAVLQWRVGVTPKAAPVVAAQSMAPDAQMSVVVPPPPSSGIIPNQNPAGKLLSARAIKSSTDITVLAYGPFDNGPLLVGYEKCYVFVVIQ